MRVALALALIAAACGGPFAAPTPTPGPALGPTALKLRLVAALGRPAFCDPDLYPVARADEAALAARRVPEIQRDAEAYGALVAAVGPDPLAVYREWKALQTVRVEPDGAYSLRVGDDRRVTLIEGRIEADGRITVSRSTPSGPLMCPICLARGTRIATPDGERAVEDLRVGDAIWTADGSGARVASTVVAAGSAPVPAAHELARVTLADGRVVSASPGHPDASGRPLGSLRPGDVLDGGAVVAVERVRYGLGRTYDVRAAGPTGAYWADGVLLGSTLR
ncbi:MAG TPA: Hint domain-containing protein [Candidatus Limnocylindria bacterium]|nr:Hint domain-containing protein [Candidatus Limnocylindria bacterium]